MVGNYFLHRFFDLMDIIDFSLGAGPGFRRHVLHAAFNTPSALELGLILFGHLAVLLSSGGIGLLAPSRTLPPFEGFSRSSHLALIVMIPVNPRWAFDAIFLKHLLGLFAQVAILRWIAGPL